MEKKIQTSDEILAQAIRQAGTEVKDDGKKTVTKKKTVGKKKVGQNNAVEKKIEKKVTVEKKEESSKEELNEGNIEGREEWFINLFDHLEYIENNNISVYNQDEEKMNGRQRSKYELERKLFLVFMASPSRIREGSGLDGYWRNLTQEDFARQTGIERNTLSLWKGQKWFISNRIDMMKYMFSKKTPNVIQNLYEGATEKDDKGKVQTPAVKLFLEYIESFKETIEHTGGFKVKSSKELDEASLDDLKDVISQCISSKSKK